MTRCITLSGLFAGEMHAFLFRAWRNRVKGRDWYDFEWYIRNQIPIDFYHFLERSIQSESIEKGSLTRNEFGKLVKKKINNTKNELVTADVKPFIKNREDLKIWSNDYFQQLVDLIRFE